MKYIKSNDNHDQVHMIAGTVSVNIGKSSTMIDIFSVVNLHLNRVENKTMKLIC